MAKFTEEALKVVKNKFEHRDFILVDGIIYRKCEKTLTIKNKKISVIRIIYSVIYPGRKWRGTLMDAETESLFKESLANGSLIIDGNQLYKTNGCMHYRGYVIFGINIEGVQYKTYAHRIIYYLHYGVWDDYKIIHHVDGNKSNNKIENLKLITQFENIIYSLQNDEIVFTKHNYIDDITREKYHIRDDAKWELFKQEAYNGFKRSTMMKYGKRDVFYKACKCSETLEEFKINLEMIEHKKK